jgi:hypothetical protein
MSAPSVTYPTFANSTTADGPQVSKNFQDLVDGLSDGTKDLSVHSLALSGAESNSSITNVVAASGGSSTIPDTCRYLLLSPAATIATYALTMPASPAAGQKVTLLSNGNKITALTLSANTGHSLSTGVTKTSMSSANAVTYVFRSNVWHKESESVPVTDWVAFTPTGSWNTNTTYTGFYKRVGDTLHMWIKISLSGSPNTTSHLTVTSFPGSAAIDTAKMLDTSSNFRIGSGSAAYGSGPVTYDIMATYSSTTQIELRMWVDGAQEWASINTGDLVVFGAFTSGNFVTALITVPISTW